MSQQNDVRRRLLVALALERARTSSPVDGTLRRALEDDQRAAERTRSARSPGDDAPER